MFNFYYYTPLIFTFQEYYYNLTEQCEYCQRTLCQGLDKVCSPSNCKSNLSIKNIIPDYKGKQRFAPTVVFNTGTPV